MASAADPPEAADSDEAARAIRRARADSNAGFAARDTAQIASHWLPTVLVTQATLGEHTRGAEDNSRMLEGMFEQRPDALYVRTPHTVVASPEAGSGFASEEGRWLGTWTGVASRGEPVGATMRKGGVYFAQWQLQPDGRWLLQAEVYTPVPGDYIEGHVAGVAEEAVVEEIRRHRAASCRAVAAHSNADIASHWLPNIIVTNSDGSIAGGENGAAIVAQRFTDSAETNPDVCFNRIPERIEVELGAPFESPAGGAAAELGRWQGSWSEEDGSVIISRNGRYCMQWRYCHVRGRWLINAEVYVLEHHSAVPNLLMLEVTTTTAGDDHSPPPPSIVEPPMVFNAHGQPLGQQLAAFVAPPALLLDSAAPAMQGRYCRLAPIDADKDAHALHACLAADALGAGWTYAGPVELHPGSPSVPPSCAQVTEWLQVR